MRSLLGAIGRSRPNAAERLARLAISAPATMREVRDTLRAAVSDLAERLGRVEKEFYGGGKPENELRKWCNNAHALMRQTRVTWIQDLGHIDTVVKRALTEAPPPGAGGGLATAAAAGKLREAVDRTLRFVPARLDQEGVLGGVETVLGHLETYCHSVYNPADDPPVRVAADYEQCARRWAAEVRRLLTHVWQLPERVLRGTLYLEEMTQGARELAMKSGSDDVACLFVFHDATECVRAALDTLRRWLDYADGYDDFLSKELADVCAVRDALQAECRTRQEAYNTLRYRQTRAARECERLADELEAAAHREAELLVAEELLLSQAGDLQLDRDIAQFRLGELQRRAAVELAGSGSGGGGGGGGSGLGEAIDEVTAALRAHDERLPALQKEVDAVRGKLVRVDERRQQAAAARDELRLAKEAALDALRAYQASERAHSAACATIELIRLIRLHLSTEGVPQKICLGLPPRKHVSPLRGDGAVRISRLDLSTLPESKMDEAINFLVRRIGNRWTEFYHHLPFHPARGTKTLESDIISIQSECVRDPAEGAARKCLEFWLRHHTLARVSDLRGALASFSSDDKQTLSDFDKLVDTRPPPPPEEEHIPASMAKELIPYYRLICRYDRLKAAAHGNAQHRLPAA